MEEALKKAAKLNPELDGAWNCLGGLFWKRGNLEVGSGNACPATASTRLLNSRVLNKMSFCDDDEASYVC